MEWYLTMLIGAAIGSAITGFIYNNMNTTKVKNLEQRIANIEAAIKKP